MTYCITAYFCFPWTSCINHFRLTHSSLEVWELDYCLFVHSVWPIANISLKKPLYMLYRNTHIHLGCVDGSTQKNSCTHLNDSTKLIDKLEPQWPWQVGIMHIQRHISLDYLAPYTVIYYPLLCDLTPLGILFKSIKHFRFESICYYGMCVSFLCVCVWTYEVISHGTCMVVRGQLWRVTSLLPLCGFWGSNWGHHSCVASFLPAEPSPQLG